MLNSPPLYVYLKENVHETPPTALFVFPLLLWFLNLPCICLFCVCVVLVSYFIPKLEFSSLHFTSFIKSVMVSSPPVSLITPLLSLSLSLSHSPPPRYPLLPAAYTQKVKQLHINTCIVQNWLAASKHSLQAHAHFTNIVAPFFCTHSPDSVTALRCSKAPSHSR